MLVWKFNINKIINAAVIVLSIINNDTLYSPHLIIPFMCGATNAYVITI